MSDEAWFGHYIDLQSGLQVLAGDGTRPVQMTEKVRRFYGWIHRNYGRYTGIPERD